LVIAAVMVATLLQGCPPNPSLHPSISVTMRGNVLIISGSGFANVPSCAQLSLQSAPTGSILIGFPNCAGGSNTV
jgi:hypothetical protein